MVGLAGAAGFEPADGSFGDCCAEPGCASLLKIALPTLNPNRAHGYIVYGIWLHWRLFGYTHRVAGLIHLGLELVAAGLLELSNDRLISILFGLRCGRGLLRDYLRLLIFGLSLEELQLEWVTDNRSCFFSLREQHQQESELSEHEQSP